MAGERLLVTKIVPDGDHTILFSDGKG